MAHKILFIGLISIILSSVFVFGTGITSGALHAQDYHIDEDTKQYILDATVRITIFAPVLDARGNPKISEVNGTMQMQTTIGEGLGTLVRTGEETLIITHDHWSMLTVKLYKVQFHSVNNELLLELDRSRLFSLYRYRDGGTLIFEAPDQLSAQMSAVELAGEDIVLRNDDTLLVAYWKLDSSEPVSVEPVVVESTEPYKELASIKMRTINGNVVAHGNSGGGVFLNGRLVGNMWETIVLRHLVDGEDSGVTSPTDLSRAAQLTY
jgi:hypothetical protein